MYEAKGNGFVIGSSGNNGGSFLYHSASFAPFDDEESGEGLLRIQRHCSYVHGKLHLKANGILVISGDISTTPGARTQRRWNFSYVVIVALVVHP